MLLNFGGASQLSVLAVKEQTRSSRLETVTYQHVFLHNLPIYWAVHLQMSVSGNPPELHSPSWQLKLLIWASNPSLQSTLRFSSFFDGFLDTFPLGITGNSPHSICPRVDKITQSELDFHAPFIEMNGKHRSIIPVGYVKANQSIITNALFQPRPHMVYTGSCTPPAFLKKLITFIASVEKFVVLRFNSESVWNHSFWTFWQWETKKKVTASPRFHGRWFILIWNFKAHLSTSL